MIPINMELKKARISNSRYFFKPHQGDIKGWPITLGKLLNKMEKDTPFISANSYCEIFVLDPSTILVGKDVVGPIRADISGIYFEDFKTGEIQQGELLNPLITFPEIIENARTIISKRNDLRDVFSIRVNQKDPILHPMGIRFFPKVYPFPKLTI